MAKEYNPFFDYKTFGNPNKMTEKQKQKRIKEIKKYLKKEREKEEITSDKFRWKKGEVTVELPE